MRNVRMVQSDRSSPSLAQGPKSQTSPSPGRNDRKKEFKSPREILENDGRVEVVRKRNVASSLLDFFGMPWRTSYSPMIYFWIPPKENAVASFTAMKLSFDIFSHDFSLCLDSVDSPFSQLATFSKVECTPLWNTQCITLWQARDASSETSWELIRRVVPSFSPHHLSSHMHITQHTIEIC